MKRQQIFSSQHGPGRVSFNSSSTLLIQVPSDLPILRFPGGVTDVVRGATGLRCKLASFYAAIRCPMYDSNETTMKALFYSLQS